MCKKLLVERMWLSLHWCMDFGLTGFGFGDILKLLEKGFKVDLTNLTKISILFLNFLQV